MPPKTKQITIDQTKLEQYLASLCSHYIKMETGEAYCRLIKQGECSVSTIDRILHHCPSDCPHFAEKIFKPCRYGQCSFIKNAIKKLL